MQPATPSITDDRSLDREAADWVIAMRYEQPGADEHRRFERWLARSPAHAAAWQRASAVLQAFDRLPAQIARPALDAIGRKAGRRRSIGLLAALLVAGPTAWGVWRHQPGLFADLSTAVGERRQVELPDGSRLVMGTATAVDIRFTATERRLRLLAGEIIVTTRPDTAAVARPFRVETGCGQLLALGTRFSVRHLSDDLTQLAVYEHAVRVQPLRAAAVTLPAGMQIRFGPDGVEPATAADPARLLWERGLMLARDLRLAEVLAEMDRHRPGLLRWDPAVADLRVTGTISLDDTDAGLRLLVATLPIRLETRTRYWTFVGPK